MFLVAGLGNPGSQYENTRHNAGFLVVDQLLERLSADSLREKFRGRFGKVTRQDGPDLALLKPMTFMNLSGESVQPALDYFNVPVDHLLVVHDELDLPFGELRIKVGGGLAGHNGLRSIAQHTGSQDFVRLRFGVGRPSRTGKSHVLGPFGKDERETLPSLLDQAVDMVLAVVDHGATAAMNAFHAPKSPKGKNKTKESGGAGTPPGP